MEDFRLIPGADYSAAILMFGILVCVAGLMCNWPSLTELRKKEHRARYPNQRQLLPKEPPKDPPKEKE